MLLISDNLLASFMEAQEKFNLIEKINSVLYKASNTDLTYRQINTFDNTGLLNDRRNSNTKWRKFSFKDLIYIRLLFLLKKYGVKNEQLFDLKKHFYGEMEKGIDKSKSGMCSNICSEMAIGCVLSGNEIYLCFSSDGKTMFFDSAYFLFFRNVFTAEDFIFIPLSSVINDLKKSANKDPIEMNYTLSTIVTSENTLKTHEKEIISLLRNKEYNSLNITKKPDNSILCKANKKHVDKKIIFSDLESIVKDDPFQDVELKVENGSISHYRLTRKFKIDIVD